MARFYTSTDNSRGNPVTAMSHKGQDTHSRGWDGGVRVRSYPMGDQDCFDVFVTSGSHGAGTAQLVGTLVVDAKGRRTWSTPDTADLLEVN